LPLTVAGKIDRHRLPTPDLEAYGRQHQYEAPQGEVEEVLARIWQDLLRVAWIGRQDNFFELGGHSLLIVKMMERLRQADLSVELQKVYESPTLAALAGALAVKRTEAIEVRPI